MLNQRLSSLALGAAAIAPLVAAGPCDIYKTANTPCVAAHSTTRALYSAYTGPLYQVVRASDSKTQNISPLSAGGVANAAAQDTFCANTQCHISIIYDQSGHSNNLSRAPPGGAGSGPGPNGYDLLAVANAAPITVNGNKAYGVLIPGNTGYRIDKTNGIATGNEPEGIYAVVDGTHYNGECCFDYGNAETTNDDNGAGNMEALNFGSGGAKGYQSGSGPWVRGDLENGLVASPNSSHPSPSIGYRFTHAVLKGGPEQYFLGGGDATSGGLTTFYDGPRPAGYKNMTKQGAIILGIGGDNSRSGIGTFYEGVMTSGFPPLSADTQVQANIVAAKYST